MSLVLRYKFNEDTASLGTDSSGNSNTLANGGGVVSISDPTYGDVAYFDGGSTSQMTLASPPATMTGSVSRTFSYWVKRYNQNLEVIHGQSLTGADEYRVQFQSATSMRIYNNGTLTSVNQSFTVGQWYHLGITFDGTTQAFYVNGVLNTSGAKTFATGTDTFMIGGSPIYAPGFVLTGDMSDFRVYDDALSDAEISTLYSEGPNNGEGTGEGTGEVHQGPQFDQLLVSSVDNGQYLHFHELELYTTSGENIALLGTASQDTTFGSSTAEAGNDGNTTGSIIHTEGSGTWTLDLDRFYSGTELASAVFYGRVGDVVQARAIGYTITLRGNLSDGIYSYQVGVCNDDAAPQTFTIDVPTDLTLQPLPPTTTIVEPPNYPRPFSAVSFLDPYNPGTYALRLHSPPNVATYNIDTDVMTQLSTLYLLGMRYNYQTREMVGLFGSSLYNLGVNLSRDEATVFYTHSSAMRKLDVSFQGLIYFSTADDEIWSVNTDGSNAQLLFSTTGTSGSVASDPHNPDTLVYVDGSDIKYRVLSTGVTVNVITGSMDGNTAIVVLDGVVYTNYYFKPNVGGFIRLNLDGSNVYEYLPPNQSYIWSFGFVVDTVNKVAYTLEDNKFYAHADPNIADLPPDPYIEPVTFTVSPSVFFLDVEWEAIESSLSYKVEYNSENSSETPETIVTSLTNLRISNLEPDSAYSISLFSSTDSISYEQVGTSGSFSTLENVVSNIDVETLRNSEGVFDISNFESDDLDQHMNALFETGDLVVRSVNNEPVTTTFVKDGGSYPLEQGVFSFAFSPSIGAGQTASLGDANISFDEVNDVIVVDGVSYADGESFTLNGKIVTVYNI